MSEPKNIDTLQLLSKPNERWYHYNPLHHSFISRRWYAHGMMICRIRKKWEAPPYRNPPKAVRPPTLELAPAHADHVTIHDI